MGLFRKQHRVGRLKPVIAHIPPTAKSATAVLRKRVKWCVTLVLLAIALFFQSTNVRPSTSIAKSGITFETKVRVSSSSSTTTSTHGSTTAARETERQDVVGRRLCLQNPFLSALNTTTSLADAVVRQMDAWNMEEQMARIHHVQGASYQEHTHARFFPLTPTMSCRPEERYCVGDASSSSSNNNNNKCSGTDSKLICGLSALMQQQEQQEPVNSKTGTTPNCVIYSIGSDNQFSFELDLLAKTNCDIHTFDCTGPESRFDQNPASSADSNHPRFHFHHVCIGAEHQEKAETCRDHSSKCGETWTLQEMQQHLNHNRIDLLKLDVNGWEWPVLESWPLQLSDTTNAALETASLPLQMVVVLHYYIPESDFLLPPPGSHRLDWKRAEDMVKLQQRLMQMGYIVVELVDQELCQHCTELTLIRVRCPAAGTE